MMNQCRLRLRAQTHHLDAITRQMGKISIHPPSLVRQHHHNVLVQPTATTMLLPVANDTILTKCGTQTRLASSSVLVSSSSSRRPGIIRWNTLNNDPTTTLLGGTSATTTGPLSFTTERTFTTKNKKKVAQNDPNNTKMKKIKRTLMKNKKNQKEINAQNKRKQKLLASADPATKKRLETEGTSLQHLEWVQFQQNISIDGFETGQSTEVQSMKKTRGGRNRKKEVKLTAAEIRMAERQRLSTSDGGQYPPKRYSDEETERLLTMAYAAIPARAGPRGTRNLKRQKLRWASVRAIRRKYKYHIMEHHEATMLKRSKKMQDIKAVLAASPGICTNDRTYQIEVLRRWASTMMTNQPTNSDIANVNTMKSNAATIVDI